MVDVAAFSGVGSDDSKRSYRARHETTPKGKAKVDTATNANLRSTERWQSGRSEERSDDSKRSFHARHETTPKGKAKVDTTTNANHPFNLRSTERWQSGRMRRS